MKFLRDDPSWSSGSGVEVARGVYKCDIVGCLIGKGREDVAEEVVSSRDT